MSHTHERQAANLLTSLALAVQERVGTAAAATLPHGASAPAALVALESTLAGGTIDALRRVLGLTHSGAVRLVDRLAAAGLVERRVGPDARSVSSRSRRRGGAPPAGCWRRGKRPPRSCSARSPRPTGRS